MFGLESLLVGRTIADRYRIDEVVGRGRTGPVCRAVDVRLGLDVAVKAVTAGAQTPTTIEGFRARFRRAAEAAAGVQHPNVAAVYDCGTDAAINLDYLVMELLRGEDLGSRLTQRGRPPVPLGLRMLLEAVHGLAAVHRAGLAHGDLRPENLFLTRSEDGKQVRVRLLAFGVAPLAASAGGAVPPLQATGAAAYVAPEQVRAGSEPTPAGDVFSLGAVGFLLLTGTAPFSDAAILAMAGGQRVAIRSPRDLNADIPAELAAVISRAISADPAARFADATQLLAALEPLVPALPMAPAAPRPAAVAAPPAPSPAADAPARIAVPHIVGGPAAEAPQPAPSVPGAAAPAAPVDASAPAAVTPEPPPPAVAAEAAEPMRNVPAAPATSPEPAPKVEASAPPAPVAIAPAAPAAPAAPRDAAPVPPTFSAPSAPPSVAAPAGKRPIKPPTATDLPLLSLEVTPRHVVAPAATAPVVAPPAPAASRPAAPAAPASQPAVAAGVVAAAAVAAHSAVAVEAPAAPVAVAPAPPAPVAEVPRPVEPARAVEEEPLAAAPEAAPAAEAEAAPVIAAAAIAVDPTPVAALPVADAMPAAAAPVADVQSLRDEPFQPPAEVSATPAAVMADTSMAIVRPSKVDAPAAVGSVASAKAPAAPPSIAAPRKMRLAPPQKGGRGKVMAAVTVVLLAAVSGIAWAVGRAPAAELLHGGKQAVGTQAVAAAVPLSGPAAPAPAGGAPRNAAPLIVPEEITRPVTTPGMTPQQKAQARRDSTAKAARIVLQQQQLAAQQAAAQLAQAQRAQQVAVVPTVQAPAPTPAPPPAPAPQLAAQPVASAPAPAIDNDEKVVEEPPTLINSSEVQRAVARNYPPIQRDNGVGGRASARFAVREDGTVDPASIVVVDASNGAFGDAAKRVLRSARYRPARVNGRAVRVSVTTAFQWSPAQ